MFQVFFLLVFVSYVKPGFFRSIDDIPTYECHVYYDDNTRCQLENLQLTNDQAHFHIHVQDPETIQEVTFVDSVIPVLSHSICKKFPGLLRLHADDSHITSILENAFEECTDIRTISLRNNKIRKLHENTFQNNLKLKELMLESNRLKHIEESTFINLVDLEFLSLPDNNLTEFAPTLLRGNQKMPFIYLFTNNLSDLDLETLHEMNPSLIYIYFNRNEFSCVRMQEMIEFAQVIFVFLS